MAVNAEDLRVELDFSQEDWTVDDTTRAEAIIASCRRRVRAMVGVHRVDRAETLEDADKLGAIDEAVLTLAVARFSNPERALHQKQGPDVGVTFSDSSDAAGNVREAREILRGAFGDRAGTVTL